MSKNESTEKVLVVSGKIGNKNNNPKNDMKKVNFLEFE